MTDREKLNNYFINSFSIIMYIFRKYKSNEKRRMKTGRYSVFNEIIILM